MYWKILLVFATGKFTTGKLRGGKKVKIIIYMSWMRKDPGSNGGSLS
jgi:hypothetical protein